MLFRSTLFFNPATHNEPLIMPQEAVLVFAVLMETAIAMVLLSRFLKYGANRWANIILGIIFAVFGLIAPIEYLAKQSAYSAYITLIGIVQVVATALIVWYAWKSKQKT